MKKWKEENSKATQKTPRKVPIDHRKDMASVWVSLFNGDLSNEPNIGWIHLAGQYL